MFIVLYNIYNVIYVNLYSTWYYNYYLKIFLFIFIVCQLLELIHHFFLINFLDRLYFQNLFS